MQEYSCICSSPTNEPVVFAHCHLTSAARLRGTKDHYEINISHWGDADFAVNTGPEPIGWDNHIILHFEWTTPYSLVHPHMEMWQLFSHPATGLWASSFLRKLSLGTLISRRKRQVPAYNLHHTTATYIVPLFWWRQWGKPLQILSTNMRRSLMKLDVCLWPV